MHVCSVIYTWTFSLQKRGNANVSKPSLAGAPAVFPGGSNDSLIISDVDPEGWKVEVERVAPLLKVSSALHALL